jgi:hypothetical protein
VTAIENMASLQTDGSTVLAQMNNPCTGSVRMRQRFPADLWLIVSTVYVLSCYTQRLKVAVYQELHSRHLSLATLWESPLGDGKSDDERGR